MTVALFSIVLLRKILDLSEALDPINRAVRQESLNHFWGQAFAVHETTNFTAKLDLFTFGVLPNFQRRGIGRALIEWGLERATQQRLPVFLDASTKSRSLFLRLGCKIIGQVVQENKTYEKRWCEKKLPAVYVERLETPVLRWDADSA